MKIIAVLAIAILATNFISALFAPQKNQSGNGVYYGSAAGKVSENWSDYDRENGEDAYINGY